MPRHYNWCLKRPFSFLPNCLSPARQGNQRCISRKKKRLMKMAYLLVLIISTSICWVVQLLSHVWLFVTPWTAAHQASLSFIIFWRLLKLMSIESMILSNHLVLCHPLLLLLSVFPSIRSFLMSWLFQSVGQSICWVSTCYGKVYAFW